MSIATAITNLTNTIRGIATTKGQIKSAVNEDFEAINNEQIEQYPNLIRNAINQYKSYIPVVTGEGKLLSLNTVPLKPKEFAVIGDTEQATSILPEGYTQLDYIESTGTQYIDTGINADNNLRVILDFAYTNPSSANQNIGAINLQKDPYARYHILSQNNWFRIYTNTTEISPISADTNRHVFDINAPISKITVDGTEYTKSEPAFDVELNYWLFGRNSTGTIYYCKVKIYSTKMYYNNVLVRDFIPCKNSSNKAGLYDLVSKTFFGNQGTGDFIAGNGVQIPNPEYPQPIQVVTGEQTVVINGKNFIPTQVEKWEQGAITTAEGTNSDNSTRVRTIDYYPIQELTDYYLSVEDTTYCFVNLFLYDSNKNYITNYYAITHSISGAASLAVNFPKNTAYYRAVMRNKANSSAVIEPSVILSAKPMLALGTAKTDYEPYNGVQLPLSLGDAELCKIEDYKDRLFKNTIDSEFYNAELEEGSWYVYKKIGKVILNGTESWSKSSKATVNRYYVGNKNSHFIDTIENSSTVDLLSDYFTCITPAQSDTNGIGLAKYNGYGIMVNFDLADERFNTLQEFKTWLSTNNTLLYYVLATPTYTKITDETLISQLEAIENTNMNEGTTIIYADNAEGLQPTLYVEAYAKVE